MKTNRHIIDRYADLTAEIKSMTDMKDALKEQILANIEPLGPGESTTVVGDDYSATVSLVERETLDRKAVEAALSKPKFQACLKPSSAWTIRTAARRQVAA